MTAVADEEEGETSKEGEAVDGKCGVEVLPVEEVVSSGERELRREEDPEKTNQVLEICRRARVSSGKVREISQIYIVAVDVEEAEEEDSRDVVQHVREEGEMLAKRRERCPADPSEGD